jgi:hypothetical protein
MSFIQRELDRIQNTLTTAQLSSHRRAELYAAQQALVWALDPTGFKPPYDMIANATDNPEGSGDCPEENGRSLSLDSPDRHASLQ